YYVNDGLTFQFTRSDGTPAGTQPLGPAQMPIMGYEVSAPVIARGRVFFSAYEGDLASLWMTDGTPAGTSRVGSTPLDLVSYPFAALHAAAGRVWFFA